MRKSEAIQILGDSPAAAAAEIGISSAAIAQWPDHLPNRLIDRVQAALYRRLIASTGVPPGGVTQCACTTQKAA